LEDLILEDQEEWNSGGNKDLKVVILVDFKIGDLKIVVVNLEIVNSVMKVVVEAIRLFWCRLILR
jgi:hypothetical protein